MPENDHETSHHNWRRACAAPILGLARVPLGWLRLHEYLLDSVSRARFQRRYVKHPMWSSRCAPCFKRRLGNSKESLFCIQRGGCS